MDEEIIEYTCIGDLFPEFKLKGVYNGSIVDITLDQFRNNWFLACAYPLDFTFVCPTEIKSFNGAYDEFERINCKMFWFSVDSQYAHLKWLSEIGPLKFPLVSDLSKELSKTMGILSEEGVAYRSTFIVDPEGIIRHISITDNSVGRSVQETLRLVKAFKTDGLCACDWQPGDGNLMQ